MRESDGSSEDQNADRTEDCRGQVHDGNENSIGPLEELIYIFFHDLPL
jgi:hypothetical protein